VIAVIEGLTNRQKTTFRNRLLTLAALLRRVKREQFDMDHWVNPHTWGGKLDFSCGTSGCVLGWATTIPSFRKAGLRMLYWKDGLGRSIDVGDISVFPGVPHLVDPRNPKVVLSAGGVVEYSKIGRMFFGLDDRESYELFMREAHEGISVTSKQKARQLEQLARQFRTKGGL
jgi:hypothetical protein